MLPFLSASSSHVDTGRGRMRSFGHRIIHSNRALMQHHPIALHFGFGGRTLLLEVHESEPTGNLRLGIVDNHRLVNGSVRCENVHQAGFVGVAA